MPKIGYKLPVREIIEEARKSLGKSIGHVPDGRYASFDYCYNYFYSFYKKNKISELASPENIERSCFQIAFYLASWGMLRGSSFLLERSLRFYIPLIKAISVTDRILWEIDLNSYNNKNIELLLNCKRAIFSALGAENKASDTLVSKIMLGVFSNIPAFDRFVCETFEFYQVNEKSLLQLRDFYLAHKTEIDEIRIQTLDFTTGISTPIIYNNVKLVDLYGFMNSFLNYPIKKK